MSAIFVPYNSVLPWGKTVYHTDVEIHLLHLINEASIHHYKFITYDNKGIYLKYTPIDTTIFNFESDIRNLELKLNSLTNIVTHDHNRISHLEIEIDNNSSNKKDTNGFYILYDLLPEHIKKELTIYIKKK